MFNKKLTFVSAILTAALMTGCAENSAPYGAGHGDAGSLTQESGSDIVNIGSGDASYGGTGAVNGKPTEDADPDASVDTEDLFHELTTVSREQMSDIPANTSYGDILKKLGNTQGYGQSNYRQYVTDDDRIIQLYFESKDDLCPYSGEELYDRALPLEYDGVTPDGMTYGILGRNGGFFTHYMMYYYADKGLGIYEDENGKRHITGDYLITNEAEIVFEDGTPATEDDLKPETPVFIQSDYVLESYPEQRHCTKIVILK